VTVVLNDILQFLACPTPAAWLAVAPAQLPLLLVDHANCEKKAAATALNLLFRYTDQPELLYRMSRLAREELRHFEQVLAIMQARDIPYHHVPPSRYAAGLRAQVRSHEPAKLVDTLIVGAFIEARSCERFAALAPVVDAELGRFYRGLLRSESRHFRDYLALAQTCSPEPVDDRVAFFRTLEAQLIVAADPEMRFHSGVPKAQAA